MPATTDISDTTMSHEQQKTSTSHEQQKTDPDPKYEKKSDSKQKTSSAKKSSGSTVVKPKPAQAVLTEKEMGRMIDLGLGRGIDATNEKPWVNKSSFQVRRVSFDNVIGTEEGGALQSYEREISRYEYISFSIPVHHQCMQEMNFATCDCGLVCKVETGNETHVYKVA